MKSKSFVSDKVIGRGKTNTWYLGSLDSNRTITIAYESAVAEPKEQVTPEMINFRFITCNSKRTIETDLENT